MAWTPMSPHERASIEAQVILKAAVELAVAEVGNDPDGVAVTMAIENAQALAMELPKLKDSLVGVSILNPSTVSEEKGLVGAEIAVAPDIVDQAVDMVQAAFPAATAAAPSRTDGMQSKYVDDEEYTQVLAIWNAEKVAGVEYAGQQSMFLCNQAIRKLFADGKRTFPDNYWAEALRGKEIPVTKNGKCGLGDFKVKRSVCIGNDGVPFLGTGEGNHPLANKSGYFAALVKLKGGFGWGDRPDPIDPHNWLSQVSA